MSKTPKTQERAPSLQQDEVQRQGLLDAQREAHRDDNRGFKEDALTDKLVHVEPDDTGPTPTASFDPPADADAAQEGPVRALQSVASKRSAPPARKRR